MPSLYQYLLDIEPQHLKVILRFWDVDASASSRRDRVAGLADAMATQAAVARAVNSISEGERRALLALRAAGGSQPMRVFGRRWGTIRPMGPAKMSREEPWRAPTSPAEGLWYKGLLFRKFEHTPEGSYEAAIIPDELLGHLPDAISRPLDLTLSPITPPAIAEGNAEAMLDDVCTLLSYVQNERIRPAGNRGWQDKDVHAIAPRLRLTDRFRLDLMVELLWDLGWVKPGEAGEMRLVSGPVAAWLQSRATRQREALSDAWLDCAGFNELCCIPSLRVERTGAWTNDPRLARRAILHCLTGCASSDWYEIEQFAGAIKRVDPDFQRPDGDYGAWYIRETESGRYLSGFESWDAVEGQVVRYLVTGPLAWLGIVELDITDASPRATSFRVTEHGSAYLGLAEDGEAPESARLVASADFTVQVPSGRRFERFQLARVADWVQSGDSYVYRIGPASLERGIRQSIGVDRVTEFLQRACRPPVPRSVLDTLAQWDATKSEARLANVDLLTVSGEETMTQIVRSASAGRLIVNRVGPAAALVRRQDWMRLIEELGRLAILPEVVDPEH